ncbi:MAG: hypothetical protein WCK46_03230 [Candidatus Adlerbacteria bacterium]
MSFIFSVPYLVWLVLSALAFAGGEFFSKKFALAPGFGYVVLILGMYALGTLLWLPAILQKNQLSLVGALWSVLSLLATVLIGVILFGEKLSLLGVIGIVFAFVSVFLLSIA